MGFIATFQPENLSMMKHYSHFRILAITLFIVLVSCHVIAQDATTTVGVPVAGERGITLTMGEIIKNASGIIHQQSVKILEEREVSERRHLKSPGAVQGTIIPKKTLGTEIIQNSTQSFHSNFTAGESTETPSVVVAPPDPMGDVGPTQVCMASNNRLKWYAKPTLCDAPLTSSTTSGSQALAGAQYSVYIDDFFSSVRNNALVTDPHVQYDRLSKRWFIVAMNTEAQSNRILIAVSDGPTISNLTSFTFYQFNHDFGAESGSSDYHQAFDFPTLGVDKNALYIGGLIFNASTNGFIGSSAFVVRKSSVVAGGPIVVTPFRHVGDNYSSGIFCPFGVKNDDPAADKGYFMGVSASSYGALNYIIVDNPSGAPSITSGSLELYNKYGKPYMTWPPDPIATLGSFKPLDAADDRLSCAMISRDRNTGIKSIWTSQNVGVDGSTGFSDVTQDRVGVRWYRIDVSGNTLAPGQAGTLYQPGATIKNYWMGSIAASGQGHAIIGATVGGPNDYANVAIAGRYAASDSGTLESPVQATSYSAAYNLQSGDVQRWGDYSATVVDPEDNMTMWTFQEFTAGANIWAIRATQLKAPPPATVTNMTAITCTGDRTIPVTITGSAGANFAGYYDPGSDAGGPGFSRHLAVTSTGGVEITNPIYLSPTSISFTMNYAGATLGSTQTLTITNPDCQSVTYNYTLPTGCQAVPVKWVSVNAEWVNGQAMVNWKVANENNVKHYELEKSTDGHRFTSIGVVSSQNLAEASYHYIDVQATEENYYRIRQTNLDGTSAYSTVASLFRKGITHMRILPNPAQSQVRIVLPGSSGTVRLLNMNGQVLFSATQNSNTLMANTDKYPRGVYVVEYEGVNGASEKQKLILR